MVKSRQGSSCVEKILTEPGAVVSRQLPKRLFMAHEQGASPKQTDSHMGQRIYAGLQEAVAKSPGAPETRSPHGGRCWRQG